MSGLRGFKGSQTYFYPGHQINVISDEEKKMVMIAVMLVMLLLMMIIIVIMIRAKKVLAHF